MCVAPLVSYLLGSVPTAYIFARLRGKDVFSEGSKNMGALNVYRLTGSLPLALLVLFIDALKGYAAVVVSALLDPAGVLLSPFFAVLGHNYPVWTKFRGGRGLSVLLGASAAIQPTFFILWSALWLLGYILSGYIALGAMLAILLTPPVHLVLFGSPATPLVLALVPIWMKYLPKAVDIVEGRIPRHFWRVRA